eukprot:775877-Karenia_brevis.AAC.1
MMMNDNDDDDNDNDDDYYNDGVTMMTIIMMTMVMMMMMVMIMLMMMMMMMTLRTPFNCDFGSDFGAHGRLKLEGYPPGAILGNLFHPGAGFASSRVALFAVL